jgi:hypothetical protein
MLEDFYGKKRMRKPKMATVRISERSLFTQAKYGREQKLRGLGII